MAFYRIEWKTSAVKDLRRVDREVIPRILHTIESLAEQPFPPNVRKIHGTAQTYRIRVGDYRVVYAVYDDHLLVEIIRVRHRKDAYR